MWVEGQAEPRANNEAASFEGRWIVGLNVGGKGREQYDLPFYDDDGRELRDLFEAPAVLEAKDDIPEVQLVEPHRVARALARLTTHCNDISLGCQERGSVDAGKGRQIHRPNV